MGFEETLSKLLGNNKQFDEVQIDTQVVNQIVKIARESDPEEYVALLSGKIDNKILKVSGLIFLPFKASSTSASMDMFMMPITTDAVGSVHSHPGPSAQPSNADRMFFGKNGYFHIIICRPYTPQSMRAYDISGTPMTFSIVDLEDEVEIKRLNNINLEDGAFEEEPIESNSKPEENNTKGSDLMANPEKNNSKDNEANQTKPKQAMLNLQIESKGKMINQQIPLPPEYEPGDKVEVDIRTDKTPGDTIDEIIVNVKKPNKTVGSKVTNLDALNQQVLDAQDESKTDVAESTTSNDDVVDVEKEPKKSANQIQKEIEELEKDINKLKAENERLKNEFKEE